MAGDTLDLLSVCLPRQMQSDAHLSMAWKPVTQSMCVPRRSIPDVSCWDLLHGEGVG